MGTISIRHTHEGNHIHARALLEFVSSIFSVASRAGCLCPYTCKHTSTEVRLWFLGDSRVGCFCMRVYKYTQTYAKKQTRRQAYKHMCVYTHKCDSSANGYITFPWYILSCVYTCTHIHIHADVHLQVQLETICIVSLTLFVCAYMHARMCEHTYTYTYIYT